jgi:hypothetical protein
MKLKRWQRPPPDWAERWGNKRSDFGADPLARDEAATAAVKAAMAPLIGPFELNVYPYGTDADVIELESHDGSKDRQNRPGC